MALKAKSQHNVIKDLAVKEGAMYAIGKIAQMLRTIPDPLVGGMLMGTTSMQSSLHMGPLLEATPEPGKYGPRTERQYKLAELAAAVDLQYLLYPGIGQQAVAYISGPEYRDVVFSMVWTLRRMWCALPKSHTSAQLFSFFGSSAISVEMGKEMRRPGWWRGIAQDRAFWLLLAIMRNRGIAPQLKPMTVLRVGSAQDLPLAESLCVMLGSLGKGRALKLTLPREEDISARVERRIQELEQTVLLVRRQACNMANKNAQLPDDMVFCMAVAGMFVDTSGTQQDVEMISEEGWRRLRETFRHSCPPAPPEPMVQSKIGVASEAVGIRRHCHSEESLGL
ncbi:hypothetical protein DL764_008717 [Monosporascus ibericus]|uniref:Uncharacterized protein n=1 Tax=Monosporascus ibericus TaxID=155417 RepID=A0A4Q4SWS2_9PEZI|nr:hypothetical protein DL764_008717 [Monosporascus ibericus]